MSAHEGADGDGAAIQVAPCCRREEGFVTEKTFPGSEWAYIPPVDAGFDPEKLEAAHRWQEERTRTRGTAAIAR